jgi:hypothetical protein
VCLKGESEELVDVVDVFINDVLFVSIGGLFTFNDLDLNLSPVRYVFEKLPFNVDNVSDRTDKAWFVLFGFMV